jgi:hypothetical protein
MKALMPGGLSSIVVHVPPWSGERNTCQLLELAGSDSAAHTTFAAALLCTASWMSVVFGLKLLPMFPPISTQEFCTPP